MFELLARRRVLVGTVYLVLVAVLGDPVPPLWWLGLVVALCGEGMRTWASGYIFKNVELAQTGPYSVVRNPLYLGSFFLGFGITMMGGHLALVACYPLLFLPIYLRKIAFEEQDLLHRFAAEAQGYFARVPRFAPRWSGYLAPPQHWNLERVLFVHREWGNWLLLSLFAVWFYPG